MLDFDMLASPNFARFVYDGDGSEPGNPAGPPGSGEVERVFADFWRARGFVLGADPVRRSLRLRRFTDVGIPAGGIFTGAEEPKTPAQEAFYGGEAGSAYDPVWYHKVSWRQRGEPGLKRHPAAGRRRP